MPHVRRAGLRCRIIVYVYYIVEHTYSGAHRRLKQFFVDSPIHEMFWEIKRPQIAYRRFLRRGIQQNFCAQVTAMDHPHMILRRTHIGRVFPGYPGMTGLKEPRQHLAPQVHRRHPAKVGDKPLLCLLLILTIAPSKCLPIQFMQIRDIVGTKERPGFFLLDPPHKFVRNPTGRMEIVRAPPLISRVSTKIEEILDIQVPVFQIDAYRSFPLASLIDRHGGVIDNLQERDDSLAATVRSPNGRSQGADRGPIVAQPSSPFGEQGVVLNAFEDLPQVVFYRRHIAGGELWMTGASVEKRWGGWRK